MTGLGDRLKEARTAKGYSLDDLQTITKIQKRYLSGIENEDYSMMPGAFYVRAFIKQYSEAVGLDADEMLTLYKESANYDNLEEENIAPPLTRSRGLKGNSRLNETIPKIIVAFFIIVIIVVVWVLSQQAASKQTGTDVKPEDKLVTMDNNQTPGNTEEEVVDDPIEEETVEPDPEPEEVVKEQVLAYESTTGSDFKYSLTDADEFKLKIDTLGDTWIGVQNEKKEELTPMARVMKNGETLELDVSDVEYVRIRVAVPSFANIYVNEEKLEYSSNVSPQNIYIEYKK
ncbi:helix-turn-helix domain-containing protein [Sporosarcina thermotolerans]|uniref:Helix-turn-helix domain-containing protein n=1 Tax=Sporosarcina thermotolerans TaxID=633404 RepID=A0AAW9A960_9BACL|nr:helix-turn-helix domain-containing protein [Sporosarcina thermotolerans]MDW0115668.1 helix-turn-helix domain-containing protein [Sporosarcina thermotolerans]WHT47052.1 helix-turn-helix domain-containing protein [Sporosarcina thermotolerans]